MDISVHYFLKIKRRLILRRDLRNKSIFHHKSLDLNIQKLHYLNSPTLHQTVLIAGARVVNIQKMIFRVQVMSLFQFLHHYFVN